MIAVTLPAGPLGPSTARRLIADTLRGLGCSRRLIERAVLVGSELVTNAVQHGLGRPLLRLLARSGRVWLAVYDASARLPRPRSAAENPWWRTNGRGLAIVTDQADRWGVEPEGTGKWVWAEFWRYQRQTIDTLASQPLASQPAC